MVEAEGTLFVHPESFLSVPSLTQGWDLRNRPRAEYQTPYVRPLPVSTEESIPNGFFFFFFLVFNLFRNRVKRFFIVCKNNM